jgi:hypothetical protein
MAVKFPSKNAVPRRDVYTVSINNGSLYLYFCFCFNHSQALEEAIARHTEEGLPLPVGTRFLVYGPCQELGCDCNGEKMRFFECFVMPESEAQGFTN